MTIVELLIGLAIIAGLFTFLANAATIALVISFSLSGMFYWVNMWFIPVAIALMNGSGRAFGLDYYVIPWIQKKLDNWWYGKTERCQKELDEALEKLRKTPNMAYFEVGYGQLYPMVKRYDYEKALRIYEQEQKETSMEGQE